MEEKNFGKEYFALFNGITEIFNSFSVIDGKLRGYLYDARDFSIDEIDETRTPYEVLRDGVYQTLVEIDDLKLALQRVQKEAESLYIASTGASLEIADTEET